MEFLAAEAFSRADASYRSIRFPMIEGPPVLVGQSHLAFKHVTD